MGHTGGDVWGWTFENEQVFGQVDKEARTLRQQSGQGPKVACPFWEEFAEIWFSGPPENISCSS